MNRYTCCGGCSPGDPKTWSLTSPPCAKVFYDAHAARKHAVSDHWIIKNSFAVDPLLGRGPIQDALETFRIEPLTKAEVEDVKQRMKSWVYDRIKTRKVKSLAKHVADHHRGDSEIRCDCDPNKILRACKRRGFTEAGYAMKILRNDPKASVQLVKKICERDGLEYLLEMSASFPEHFTDKEIHDIISRWDVKYKQVQEQDQNRNYKRIQARLLDISYEKYKAIGQVIQG